MAVLLSQIHEPADLKNLSVDQLTSLAAEIRRFLIESCRRQADIWLPIWAWWN
ncbi:hypothetical protein HMSSN036_96900 [Paenibacillus macerans]|nr:hypothetical protein HMSSN036_96900 [Paenibacillus macerans]